MAISIREFKARLSHYLAQVRAGHPVEISSHRKVIARVTAVPDAEEKGVGKLVALGAAQWEGGKPDGGEIRLSRDGTPLSDMVVEDRR